MSPRCLHFEVGQLCCDARPETGRRHLAVSSRGLGHSPLKAGTRVRIPLPLLHAQVDCRCIAGVSHARLPGRSEPRSVWRPAGSSGRCAPGRAVGRRPYRLSVRTLPFQGGETGSIHVGAIAGPSHDAGRQDRSWGRSSVWLEHSTVTREVAGSSPVGPVVFAVGLVRARSHSCAAPRCPGGEIGRHAILRGWCRKA